LPVTAATDGIGFWVLERRRTGLRLKLWADHQIRGG
jgi:hypothetical protein